MLIQNDQYVKVAFLWRENFVPLYQQILLSIKNYSRIHGNITNEELHFKRFRVFCCFTTALLQISSRIEGDEWLNFLSQKSTYFLMRPVICTFALSPLGVQPPRRGLTYASETESAHSVQSLPWGDYQSHFWPTDLCMKKNLTCAWSTF